MRVPGSLLIVALLAVPTAAPAATSPPGVNLRWDRCFADAGPANKSFACNTNAGTDRLAMSFELADPLARVISITSRVQLTGASSPMPAWWDLFSAGSCRQTVLSYNTLPPVGSVNCVSWTGGSGSGAIASYGPAWYGAPALKQVAATMSAPVSSSMDLSAGTEYSLGVLVISHLKTTGSGACAGCSTPVCLLFSDILITSLDEHGDPSITTRLTKGANYVGSAIASWQNSYPYKFNDGFYSGSTYFPTTVFQCVPYDVTGSRASTWGQIKSLYR